MKRLLLYILMLCPFFAGELCAQMPTKPTLSWHDFVEEYYEDADEENNAELSTQREWLEQAAQNPLQINTISRSELLQFPFLTEEQADSILSYRTQKKGFLALGELQLVKNIDYFTRRYLSLFLRCDSLGIPTLTHRYPTPPLKEKLIKGKHELESHVDIPLYKRAGYTTPAHPTTTNFYTGNSLAHTVRYRYNYKKEIYYGLTTQKDAGEPVAVQGFYPYDYWSGYAQIKLRDKPWSITLGDFHVLSGRGLLYGRQQYGGKSQQARNVRRGETTYKPHTSTSESDFFRGAAASLHLHSWALSAFVSYRLLDARFNSTADTATSILTTGLHRTLSEINAKRTLGCLTTGANVAFNQKYWGLNINSLFAHFNHTVYPQEATYNQHYFRGVNAGAFSLTYYANLSKWLVQGEAASDAKMHLAFEQLVAYNVSRKLAFHLQVRFFSPRFVSLYGKALQEGSRVANEQGALLSVRYLPQRNCELTAYVDLFRHDQPTYQAKQKGSNGMEISIQGIKTWNNVWKILARYHLKTKQYTWTDYNVLEYRNTHKLRLQTTFTQSHYDLGAQLDGTYAFRQSGSQNWGWGCSLRANYKPSTRFQLKSLFGIFFTDNYDTRIYVYEPQLWRASSFTPLSYHGMRGVLLINWRVIKPLCLSLRYSSTHYFNKNSISSRLDLIDSSWKNDLSLQARLSI